MNRIVALTFAFVFLFTGSASAQVALLDSMSTREFFARHYPDCTVSPYLGAEEYQRYFRGWEFVLNEMGVPYTIISDEDLATRLDEFRVLILSNAVSLSDEHVRAIHKWVIGGGSLLATFGTSYKDVTIDAREIDRLRAQKGGTFGLHQLWHDPASKLFSSAAIGGAVDVEITRFEGPTAGFSGREATLAYGGLANLLMPRPLRSPDVLAWLRVGETVTRYPAIISTSSGRGHTIYYSFAPEYIVSKEFEGTALMPDLPVCPDGQNWAGRSEALRVLMRDSVSYLMGLSAATPGRR